MPTIEANLGYRLAVPEEHRNHVAESAPPLWIGVYVVDGKFKSQLGQYLAEESLHLMTEVTPRPGEQLKLRTHSHSIVPGGLLVIS